MLIPKDLIDKAKQDLGEEAARIIAKDLQLRDFDDRNLKSICPFHLEDTPSFVWNPSDNCFHCFGECGTNYGIVDHYIKFYGLTYLGAVQKLFDQTNTHFLFGEKGVKTERDYRYPKHVDGTDRSAVEEYLGLRKISKETLDYADITQDVHKNIVFHYYDANDVLTAVKYRPSHKYDKGIDKTEKYWAQSGADNDAGTLYLANRADPAKSLVLTEGEIDALSVYESGWTNVCSIPCGAGKNKTDWIDKNFQWLEQFDSVIIWFDNDAPGVISRKEACARIGTWKTRFVNVPFKTKNEKGTDVYLKDANEVLIHLGKKAVLNYILSAEEVPIPDITDLSLAEDFDIETAPGLKSNLKALDDVVYKFVYGSLVILTGKRGSGKSVLLNQIFVNEAMEQGEKVFIYSAELGTSVLKTWVETPLIGREYIELKDEFIRKFDSNALKEMRAWYKGKIFAYDSLDNDIEKVLNRAINATRKFGCKIWIIDNLMSLDIGSKDADYLQKQKDLVVRLVSLALTYGVLIVLVGHPRKTANGQEVMTRLTADDVSGSGDIGNMAHYILAVHRYSKKERAGEKDDRKGGYKVGKEPVPFDVVIDVLKNRYTGKVDECPMYFDYPSYRFYHKPKELWKRYSWNTCNTILRTDDPNNHGICTPEGFGED